MLLDIAAWALLLAASAFIGGGVLAVFGAHHVRAGDRLVLAAWIGVVLLALALLVVSLLVPLSPWAGLSTAALLAAAGWRAVVRGRRPESRRPLAEDVPLPAAVVGAGITCIAIGAAALASDPVTLYDSLVYHVGIARWLHEHGVVPGVALIHNRLGHVSPWFALSAPFDASVASDRATNIPLGLALVLVAAQAALAIARMAARRATGADAFLALASMMLMWGAVRYSAATPSPDAVTNALIVVVAWSLLVVSHVSPAAHSAPWHRWLTPRLLPLVLAAGAATMKLFALPAVIAAALFYTFAPADDRGAGLAARRAAVCGIVAMVLMLPLLAANVIASGCPLFPSPVGCVNAAWSVGADAAGAYAEYIRDVARWEMRQTFSPSASLAWVGPWVAAHPVVFMLVLLSPGLAAVLLLGPRRGGVRSALLVGILGLAFVAWQAPAPRFLYAYAIIAPLLAVAFPLASVVQRGGRAPHTQRGALTSRPAATAFIAAAMAAGTAYAVASQKLNVRTAVGAGMPALAIPAKELVVPAAPERPMRLYRWRVNDFEVFTPVPRPVADTLGYTSTIDGNLGFERCSTARLPCTPYLPARDVRLRSPARGIAAGFVRASGGPTLTADSPRCIGELRDPFGPSMLAGPASGASVVGRGPCGEPPSR